MSAPASNEVLQVQYTHISEQLAKVLAVLERTATRDEVREADAAIRSELREMGAEVKALGTRMRAQEDARTATDSLVSTVKWVIAAGGGSILLLIIRYLVLGSV